MPAAGAGCIATLDGVEYLDATADAVSLSAQGDEVAAAEIQTAATFARLSGLCYLPQADLADALDKEGLRLVASGHTHFTRWV